MNTEFYTFGEILWDCLPSGRHAGGAPFNVAAHLSQLGISVSLISAVGQDALGDELLQVARDKGIHTDFLSRAHLGLATGTVLVKLDEQSNATYELVQPVAWDEIKVAKEALEAVAKSRALIFGSLAVRSAYNFDQLERLLDLKGPVKFFDVNLRPPFADPALVIGLAKRTDVIKLNDDEVGQLAAWIKSGEMIKNTPRTEEALAEDCAVLAEATGTTRLCITRAADGASFWDRGEFHSVPATHTKVRDTVGAGDAFMAGLVAGLTRGWEIRTVLEMACHLGAYVASQDGATPLLPRELVQEFRKG